MLGTVINSVLIIGGGLLGVILKNGLKDKYKDTIMNGLGLTVIVIGLMGALEAEDILLVIISIALGSLIGEALRIEDNLEKLGDYLESKMGGGDSSFSKGFVTTSLIYCVGAMAIVGSLESGLAGNHETLIAKGIIDGITAIVFASTLGIGVVFSAVSVFLYQGTITVTASLMKSVLTDTVVLNMSAVGGLLIMGIAINILGISPLYFSRSLNHSGIDSNVPGRVQSKTNIAPCAPL